MPERFDVYRFEIDRPGEAPETRWSFAPMQGVRYAGRDEPLDANPLGNEAAETGQSVPAGHVEAPEGTTMASLDPPVLDIPGRGRVDLHAVIGATAGSADELGHLVRWRPRG
ncbi:hypothetical protein [Falsiroseomonas sp. CW058]|uniref:hypothetical protein n=1 Tax=Falsiroseomonas sp. CW058 TaxID=3388664 RepID=UPI003D31697B